MFPCLCGLFTSGLCKVYVRSLLYPSLWEPPICFLKATYLFINQLIYVLIFYFVYVGGKSRSGYVSFISYFWSQLCLGGTLSSLSGSSRKCEGQVLLKDITEGPKDSWARKVARCQGRWPELSPWNTHGRRRALNRESHPLSSKLCLGVCAPYTYIHISNM